MLPGIKVLLLLLVLPIWPYIDSVIIQGAVMPHGACIEQACVLQKTLVHPMLCFIQRLHAYSSVFLSL